MFSRKLIFFLVPALWVIIGLQFGLSLHQLPARLASHFNASGAADGWMDRGTFIASWIATVVFLNVLVIGICWGIRFLPASMFNLPHRDYWLSPAQRPTTMRAMLEFGFGLAFAITLLFGELYGQTLKANELQPPHLPPRFWLHLIPALGIMTFLLLDLATRFRKIPADAAPSEPRAAQ
jgi:hypothetical protein